MWGMKSHPQGLNLYERRPILFEGTPYVTFDQSRKSGHDLTFRVLLFQAGGYPTPLHATIRYKFMGAGLPDWGDFAYRMWLKDWKLRLDGETGTIIMATPFHPDGIRLLDGKRELQQRSRIAVPSRIHKDDLKKELPPVTAVCQFLTYIEGIRKPA